MSLLTGAPRTATVTAVTDCDLLEIDADAFRGVVLDEPAILDAVTAAVSARRAELDRHRTRSRIDDRGIAGDAPLVRGARPAIPAL